MKGDGMHRRPHGFTLVELMIGIAVGLFLVAGASKFFVDHLRNSRQLLAETRLNQDLRAVLETISHELRRAGYWAESIKGVQSPTTANPYSAIAPTATDSLAVASFTHDAPGFRGFRVDSAVLNGYFRSSWQALTDIDSLRVTDFSVSSQAQTVPLGELCTPACAPGGAGCPALVVRRLLVSIEARSAVDPSVLRRMQASVRVRNDEFTTPSCP